MIAPRFVGRQKIQLESSMESVRLYHGGLQTVTARPWNSLMREVVDLQAQRRKTKGNNIACFSSVQK